MVTREHRIAKGDSLLLKIMADKDKNKTQDKQQHDHSPPFSEKQMVFLHTLVGERDPPNSKPGKGKELAKTSTKETDKLDELLGRNHWIMEANGAGLE